MALPRIVTFAMFALGLAACAPRAVVKDARMFQADAAHSGVAHSGPVGPAVRLRWKQEIDNMRVYPPLVAGGLIFTGHESERIDPETDKRIYLLTARDAASGNVEWKQEIDGQVSATPAWAEGTLFYGTRDGKLVALDTRTRKEKWSCKVGDQIRAPLTYHRGLLFATATRVTITKKEVEHGHTYDYDFKGGLIAAVDAASGEKKWQFETRSKYGEASAPAAAGDLVYVGSSDERLYALDREDGRQRWAFAARAKVFASPTVAGEMVLFGNAGGTFFALDANSGEQLWKFESGEAIFSTAAFSEDRVIFAHKEGVIFCLGLEDGKELWRYDTKDEIMYSPVLAGGSAYIGQEYLYMHALDIESGKRLWRFTSPDGIGTSAVVEDGVLYFTGAEHLYALESAPAAEKAGKRLPALNPVDAARIRSMLGHESLLEMKPEERAHLAAAALSEIEGRRLPEPMIRMLESIANSPPAERAYVVYEQVEKLVEEWETTCPYGMRILQAISCADPEKKIEILYEGCKLERFELLEVERCKKSPLGACLFVVFLIHDYLERHDALQPIETRLFRLMLTGQDPEKDGE